MPAQEAFHTETVSPEGIDSTLRLDTSVFEKGAYLGDEVRKALNEVRDRIQFMREKLGPELSLDELNIASKTIAKELNDSIPSKFWKEYKEAGSWQEAADLITGKILSNVNHFIGEIVERDLKGTGKLMDPDGSRLHAIMDAVDDASWTGSIGTSEEAAKIYEAAIVKGRGRKPTPAEIKAFKASYRPSGT